MTVVSKNKTNAAGLIVSGKDNPNWKGGMQERTCLVCKNIFKTKPSYTSARYCSLKCVGESQLGKTKTSLSTKVNKACEYCGNVFLVYKSHSKRVKCCSKACSFKRRSEKLKGNLNPSWTGGLSRVPYTFDWLSISFKIRSRDGHKCMNTICTNKIGKGKIEVHHIDHNKNNNSESNLITLCSVCNSKANFNRQYWVSHYTSILKNVYGHQDCSC